MSLIRGAFRPLSFDEMMDRKTGRMRVRMVDIESDRYMIARRYMLRLRKDDFEDASEIAKFATVLDISLEHFEREFRHLVEDEPVPRPFYPEADGRRPSFYPTGAVLAPTTRGQGS